MTSNPANPRVFNEWIIPVGSELAGYSALIAMYGVEAPVRAPSVVANASVRGGRKHQDSWTIFDKRFMPENSLAGQLAFAFRNEQTDLLVLKRLFQKVSAHDIASIVEAEPTGATARRIWFFYEWLTNERVPLPDLDQGNYVEALDSREYFTSQPVNSPRHRVRDNLLGTPSFCPMLRRSNFLSETVDHRWNEAAKELIGKIDRQVIARAASFLLLADSQATYQIEGERPPRNRLELWMRAVAQAGRRPLSIDELVRLQHIVIEEDRFIKRGLRDAGGFIGGRDWNNDPSPEHLSARHEDVADLLQGVIACGERMAKSDVDAVLQASVMAFAFVFIHPFEDGNGRLHRYMIHHVLSERGYTPTGMIFPVSSVLLKRQAEYGEELRAFTGPLLQFVEWVPTDKQNVRVINDTADLYRFGDYTEITEFLYECVVTTIEHDLPREIEYLARFDEAKGRIQSFIEMPDGMISTLINFVRQNDGVLAKKRRRREFEKMTDLEVEAAEAVVREVFEMNVPEDGPELLEEVDPPAAPGRR
ncbi:Fic family protein [Rhizobium ruizarguesonis]|uniref:Fic family protein n=1 Tax=Rhizobium ruizarguesonis TaxID=2081791 RepID=UPI0010303373|nr:Fic family protein [Rhizobium ruizarguesonis]TAU37124.1 cell filamentation protein Fic [Rhizobium ruizarguesonis]TAU46030.1 cell filamentation protein Fic [Rhizobium ruizarguesonis]TAX67258.1 cell filamentation protein Fic [Rhizobium ruizarguesonis]TBD09476.1 cell filamentation protein Fic [Rhizobium ruizarguesonis]TBD33611.1 cell filamentation protein Fic [Rhizobium ruizarguesonis]